MKPSPSIQKTAITRFCTIVIFLFVLCCSNSYAQTTIKKSLLSIIEFIEQKHDVRFSYATNEVSSISLPSPASDANLEEILRYLNQNTPLHFTKIDERYITVVSKKKENQLCGNIVNAHTGVPLNGANIIVNNTPFSTITDASGTFYLSSEAIGKNITISHLGYETVTLIAKRVNNDCQSIALTQTIATLNEVLIKRFFINGISKQQDGSISLNTTRFGLLPGQVEHDVLQIAQALPGVESVDETISNINIRGGTRDENLILWDGIKMYQSGHFFGLISAFNPNLTKNVTIYKNGTNPQYGESVSGVIDMRSKNIISNVIEAGAGFNLINGNVFLDIPISKKLGLQVSGRKSINNLIETSVYNTYTQRIFQDTEVSFNQNNQNTTVISTDDNFSFYDFSGKLLWDLSEKDKIRVNYLTIDNTLTFTETIENPQQSKTSTLEQQSMAGGISWDRTWNEKLETNVLGYGSFYQLDAVNKDIFTTQEQLQENEVLETGIKLDASFFFSEKYTTQAGYHFSEIGVSNTQDINLPRFRSFEKDVLRTHIVYSNLQYIPNKKTTIINAGVRLNYFTKFKKILAEPRLSVHQKLGNGFAIEVLGEFKSQTTTQRIDLESDFLGIEKRRWVLATDKETPVIESKQVSLGLVFNKDNWFVNLEGFYKKINGITSSNQGFQNQFQFVRTNGSYMAKGVEFVLNKKVKASSAWFTYTYIDNKYNFDALTPSKFSNNLDIGHSATLAAAHTFKKIKIALGLNWHSGKPYTIPVTGEEIIVQNEVEVINFNTPNKERLSDYFRADISAEYIWKLSGKIDVKINAAILNILNKKNVLNIRYSLDTDESGNARINQIEEHSLRFTPNFALQVLF